MWSSFDSIYCINLIDRDDRYTRCKSLFDQLQLPVTFFRTERHVNGGQEGCYESHVHCIRQAYESGADNCLIFEDDVILDPSMGHNQGNVLDTNIEINNRSKNSSTESVNPIPKNTTSNDSLLDLTDLALRLEPVSKFMSNRDEWDLFYLGGGPCLYNYHKKINKSILRGPCYCCHAYVINRSFMARILRLSYNQQPIDKVYVDMVVKQQAQSFYLFPFIFYQGNFGSDIETSDAGGNTISSNKIGAYYAYYVGQPWYIIFILWIVIVLLFFLTYLALYRRQQR